jgi:hypothetical protein
MSEKKTKTKSEIKPETRKALKKMKEFANRKEKFIAAIRKDKN